MSNFCSRQGVGKTKDHWKVSTTEKFHIDRELSRYLSLNSKSSNIYIGNYTRQYLGFHTMDGEKRVYINAMKLDSSLHPSILKELRSVLIEGCDGGSTFWGIVYDIDSKKFMNFETNGSLPP